MTETHDRHFNQIIEQVERATQSLLQYRATRYDGAGRIGRLHIHTLPLHFPTPGEVLYLEFRMNPSGHKVWVCAPLEAGGIKDPGVLFTLPEDIRVYNEAFFVSLSARGTPPVDLERLGHLLTRHSSLLVGELHHLRDHQSGPGRFFLDEQGVFQHLAIEQFGPALLNGGSVQENLHWAARLMRHKLQAL